MATSSNSSPDTPVSIQGYVTDPKMVGYQLLTNYESTYWAPLVGNDAWRLYEVLRSFCHEGKSTCYPSINLLLAILGVKDRSVLIGRGKPKIVKGKEYYYPGLIQILQDIDLSVAEIQGEGPKMRYVFHVNMTPGLLTDAQMAKLPKTLQKKHKELMKRCELDKRKLDGKKRPVKLQINGDTNSSNNSDTGGIGNSNTPSWNFQGEQYPIDNTHKTTSNGSLETERDNNNSSGKQDPKQDVVVVLTQRGISENVAQRLTDRHKQERIEEKIEFLEFTLETEPDKAKNPAGWLRRAIEENWAAPEGFISQAHREQQADEKRLQAQETEAQKLAWQEDRRRRQEEEEQAQAAYLQLLNEKYATTDEDIQLWAELVQNLKSQGSNLHALSEQIQPLKFGEETVLLGAPSERIQAQFGHPGTHKIIEREIEQVAGRPLTLEIVVVAPPR